MSEEQYIETEIEIALSKLSKFSQMWKLSENLKQWNKSHLPFLAKQLTKLMNFQE